MEKFLYVSLEDPMKESLKQLPLGTWEKIRVDARNNVCLIVILWLSQSREIKTESFVLPNVSALCIWPLSRVN